VGEVFVGLGGTGLHETVFGCRRLERGTAAVLRPGAWHSMRECRDLTLIACCFRARLLERELLWLAEEPRLRFMLWQSTGDGFIFLRLPPAGLMAALGTLDRLAEPPSVESRPHQ